MGGAYLWLSEALRKGEDDIDSWGDGWTLKWRILLITSELVSVKGGTYLQLSDVLRKGAEPIYNWSDA